MGRFVATSRNSIFFVLLSAAIAVAQAPIAGKNVNMVSGTDWTNGDPFLERQNEPSVAVSTRNTMHLLAGNNDYRTVDIPGVSGISEPGDAWLGLFKSFDGGFTWQSTLMPGYPQDTSTVGMASAMHGFQAAADPTVRAGTNGLFYYSNIAFNRGTNALGAVFVSTFIDNNNKENGNATAENGSMTNLAPTDPIRYLRTVMIDSGTSGQFVDKPWLAIDVPRGGTCTVNYTNPDGTSGSQTIPAGRAFLAYTNFTGGGSGTNSSKILIAYSSDCGATWTKPIKVSQTNSINQGTVVAIDPSSAANSKATMYVAWRRFASSGQPDAILISKSTDGGASWSKAANAITFPTSCLTTPSGTGCAFDQGSSGTAMRTNAYPALAVDDTGRVYVAVSQRQASGDARIVMTVSADGVNWPNAPVPVDNGPVYNDDGSPFLNLSNHGHQVMPALNYSAGLLTLVYYDLRLDHTIGVFIPGGDVNGYTESRDPEGELASNISNPQVFNTAIDDAPLTIRRHTIDVEGSQATEQLPGILTTPVFNPFRVSKYAYGINPYDSSSQAEQLEVNAPNLPMFVQGTTPFMGDYIDVAPAPAFVYQKGKWAFNTANTNPQYVFTTWTDNRNVVPPPDNNWTKFTPVYSPSNPQGQTNVSKFDPTQTVQACNNAYSGTRNQDIYSSRLDPGLVMSSPGNSKTLGYVSGSNTTLLVRAFPLAVRNNTTTPRSFRLTIANQPALANGNLDPLGSASFQESGALVTTLDVTIPSFSSIARSVFVQSANPTASVMVTAAEITQPGGGFTGSNLNGSVTFNPDPNAPQIINPDPLFTGQNPSILNSEVYYPAIQPAFITSPVTGTVILNPAIQNPAIQNPAIQNQNYTAALNPAIQNPAIQNPAIQNPAIQNPAIQNTTLSDAVYPVTNTGNTAATYAVKLFGSNPNNASLQLILAKQYLTNTQDTQTGCQLAQRGEYNVFANVANPVFTPAATLGDPNIFDPTTTNATLYLAPGETGQIIIRGNLSPTDMQTLLGNLSPVAVAHAANSGFNPATLTVLTQSLPDGFTATNYNQGISILGGVAPITWSISAGALPPGLSINSSTGAITGTPNSAGDYNFTVQVMDSAQGLPSTVSQALMIHVGTQITLSSTALPDAIIGQVYSTSIPATGGTGTLTYSLTGGSLPIGLSLDPSGIVSGTATVANPAGATFSPQIQIQDSGNPPQSITATLTLRTVTQLAAGGGATTTLPNAIAGQQYSAALTATGGTGTYTWSITSGSLPSNLNLNSATGVISGIPNAAGPASFTATVQDQSNPSQSASTSVSLTVAPLLVININAGVTDGVVGTAYNASLTATGGTGTLTWAVANGSSLPPGLSLSPGGQITGTPTTANTTGTTTNVTATDSGQPPQAANATITIRIGAALVITSASNLPDAVVGVPYSQTFTSSGGIGAVTWSATGLPQGLSMSSTGVLSGTPTSVTSTSLSVSVSDSSSPKQTSSGNFNLHTAALLMETTTSLPDAVVGNAYSQALSATGGTGTYKWSASGALPNGLTLSSAGVLSGTPTTPTPGMTFTATVTDSGAPAQSSSRSLTIRVGAKLTITTTSLASASYGASYTQNLAATGGLGSYTWSMTAGSLPSGITLSTGGVLSGTPSALGTFSFTATVVDASSPQQVASMSFTLSVSAAYSVVFTVQPSTTSPGAQITPAVKVLVTDSKGHAVRGAVCVATLGVNPSGGTLSGTTTATTGNNGIAVFASQSINLSGNGYQMLITITSPVGGGSVLSVPFNIN